MKVIEFNNWKDVKRQRLEEIRGLYSNINFTHNDIKLLGITSSVENEGKTYIAMELAKMYAGGGKKVCFLDADLRKSYIMTTFTKIDPENRQGLTEYLKEEATLDDIIYETNVDNFYMVPCGSHTSKAVYLFNKSLFNDLLIHLKETFDLVIVDMPPINLIVDGSIIASKCDGVLFVVKSHATRKRDAIHAKAQLERAHVNVIGAVLNRVPKKYMDYYYYNYKTYYGSNHTHSKKSK